MGEADDLWALLGRAELLGGFTVQGVRCVTLRAHGALSHVEVSVNQGSSRTLRSGKADTGRVTRPKCRARTRTSLRA